MKFIRNLIYAGVFGYVSLLAFCFGMQRSLLYQPHHPYATLEELRIDKTFREVSYKTEDGIDLKGWHAPASKKPLTILYFHGNADSLQSVYPIALPYIQEGYGFFLAEYRGYSGFGGKPSEDGLYADARAAMMKLFDSGIDPASIVPMGHSLGSGPATQMAAEYRSPGLILIAPFRSAVHAAQKFYPYFPVDLMMLDRFNNEQKIGALAASVLIVHGQEDRVIDPAQGRALFEAAKEPKAFHLIPARDHSDLFDDSLPLTLPWLDDLSTADH